MRVLEVVDDTDDIARVLHGARAPKVDAEIADPTTAIRRVKPATLHDGLLCSEDQ